MGKKTLIDHDPTKAAAQYLLQQGLATYVEIADLSGRSRQIIRHWAQQLDAETARQKHLAKLWRDTVREVSKP
jgi:predicted transcriptional regulator